MAEVEIDLGMLEDMCSEIEEFAILTDTDTNVVWMNSVLKNAINMSIRDDYIDSKKILLKCEQLFGGILSNNSLLKRVFVAGKLLKSVHFHNDLNIKMISIPIKNGSEVLYSLNIIEILSDKMPKNALQNNIFNNEIKNVKDDDDKNTTFNIYGISPNHTLYKHDTENDIENIVEKNSESDAVTCYENSKIPSNDAVCYDLLQFFIDASNKVCFVVSDDKIVSTSSRFNNLFKKNDVLKKHLYDNIHLYGMNLSYLKKLFEYSYTIIRKPIIKEKKCVGYVYFLEPKIFRRLISKSAGKTDKRNTENNKRNTENNKRNTENNKSNNMDKTKSSMRDAIKNKYKNKPHRTKYEKKSIIKSIIRSRIRSNIKSGIRSGR